MVVVLGTVSICFDRDIASKRDPLKKVQESSFLKSILWVLRDSKLRNLCMCGQLLGAVKGKQLGSRELAPQPCHGLSPKVPNILFLCMYSLSPPYKLFFLLFVSG